MNADFHSPAFDGCPASAIHCRLFLPVTHGSAKQIGADIRLTHLNAFCLGSPRRVHSMSVSTLTVVADEVNLECRIRLPVKAELFEPGDGLISSIIERVMK